MSELEVAGELVDPRSGELVATPDRVVDVLDYIRFQRQELYRLQRVAEELLVMEAERRGANVFEAGGHKVQVSEQRAIVWDEQRLERELRALGLPEERLAELMQPTVTYKVSARVANQIVAASPDVYGPVVSSCRQDVLKGKRVSLK